MSAGSFLTLLAKHKRSQGGGQVAPNPLLAKTSHYWKLDEAAGDRLDSVGTMHMTVQGVVGSAAGKIGNCATFGGTPNYLKVVAPLLIPPATGATVWGWINLTEFSRMPALASSGDYWILAYLLNRWEFTVRDSVLAAWTTAQSNDDETLGAWHFICGRYNPSTKKAELRVNANAWIVAGSALTNDPKSAGMTTIVMNTYSGDYGTGAIDEVGFAPTYFSNDEVDQLYNGGAGLSYPF